MKSSIISTAFIILYITLHRNGSRAMTGLERMALSMAVRELGGGGLV